MGQPDGAAPNVARTLDLLAPLGHPSPLLAHAFLTVTAAVGTRRRARTGQSGSGGWLPMITSECDRVASARPGSGTRWTSWASPVPSPDPG